MFVIENMVVGNNEDEIMKLKNRLSDEYDYRKR